MASFIAQLLKAGIQVVGRALARAVKQEIAASQEAAQRLGNARTRTERMANQKHGLSLEEAQQILNISKLSREEANQRYEELMKANEKGGTLYIQSKIVRAKERIDHELNEPKPDVKEEKT